MGRDESGTVVRLLDHLNGRLFIDYLGAVKRTMITSRMRKLKREKARA